MEILWIKSMSFKPCTLCGRALFGYTDLRAVSHKLLEPMTSWADWGSSARGEETPAGSHLVHSAPGLRRVDIRAVDTWDPLHCHVRDHFQSLSGDFLLFNLYKHHQAPCNTIQIKEAAYWLAGPQESWCYEAPPRVWHVDCPASI